MGALGSMAQPTPRLLLSINFDVVDMLDLVLLLSYYFCQFPGGFHTISHNTESAGGLPLKKMYCLCV